MCANIHYTSNSNTTKFETVGWRLHASGLGKKTLQRSSGKHFLLLKKNTIRHQFFAKLFPLSIHLSAFEVTFIKISNHALCQQKKNRVLLKDCTQMTLSHQSFSSQSLVGFFFYSCSFTCAFYSDDSS